jgi:hypothetical protein
MSEEQPTTGDSAGLSEIERLMAVLESGGPDTPEEPEEVQEAEEADEVVEGQEPEQAELDEETEEVEDSTEEVEDPTEETESEDAEDEQAEQTFEINGEQVGVDELKLGYMRQSDYTKKTQAVAEQRKAVEEQGRQYESTLQALLTAAGADLSRFENVDWEQVAVQNPDQYRQAKAVYEQSQQTFNFIKSQAQEHMARMQEQAQTALRDRARESLSILKSTIPNWSNDLYYKIGDYASATLGVSAEEFNNTADHRTITALWKAMQFDQAKQVTAEKKVKASPNKTLSGKKADAKKVTNAEKYRKSRDRLRKTGSMDAAVEALLNRS